MSQTAAQDSDQKTEEQVLEEVEHIDSLASFLHSNLPAIGFSEQAFRLDSIDRLLKDIRRQDNISERRQLLDQLTPVADSAFTLYAKGMRYGFVNPVTVFSKNDYDIQNEQPDSLFYDATEKAFHTDTLCQYLRHCTPTSQAYKQLQEAYQRDTTAVGRQRLALNMERLRWRNTKEPDTKGRWLWVNIPAQRVWGIRPDSVFSMKICCGSSKTRTPLLTSAIHLIQLNPEWNIPVSIIRNEVSHHAGDSAYFARNDYYITDREGNQIDPKEITKAQLRTGAYRVAQRSGAGNSLGRIIFRFPNRFSVYLHDTNNKSAFRREVRTLSHGCVRLERPFDMLLFMLPDADPWLIDRMRLSIDKKPETDKGRKYLKEHKDDEEPIRLINSTGVNPRVPVVLNYFTAHPNPETGKVETWPDRYSYDKMLASALKPFLR